jgi:hypothetical protein
VPWYPKSAPISEKCPDIRKVPRYHYAFAPRVMRTKCCAKFILFLLTLIIFGECFRYGIFSSLLLFPLCPFANILLRSLFSHVKMCWRYWIGTFSSYERQAIIARVEIWLLELYWKVAGITWTVRTGDFCRCHFGDLIGIDDHPLQSQHVPLTSANNWILTWL